MKLTAAAPILSLLALTLVMPSAASAQSEDSRWVKRVLRHECREDDDCVRRYHQRRAQRERRARQAYYGRRPPEVRSYIRRADDEREARACRDTKRVVGNQHLTVNGAKAEAEKAWIQSIRFYFGEVYMSLENAKEIKFTCSRSSVGETLGQTFNRCEIEARPCKAEPIESAEK